MASGRHHAPSLLVRPVSSRSKLSPHRIRSSSPTPPSSTCGRPAPITTTIHLVGIRFRIAPGVRVRVGRRGVRMGIGPRVARVHLGSGRPGLSTGIGPFGAYTSLGSSGRRPSHPTDSRQRQQTRNRQTTVTTKPRRSKHQMNAAWRSAFSPPPRFAAAERKFWRESQATKWHGTAGSSGSRISVVFALFIRILWWILVLAFFIIFWALVFVIRLMWAVLATLATAMSRPSTQLDRQDELPPRIIKAQGGMRHKAGVLPGNGQRLAESRVPGWYPYVGWPAGYRWWDGRRWTNQSPDTGMWPRARM